MDHTDFAGLSLSRLGIGTVQFGIPYGINNNVGMVSYEDVVRILSLALDAGVTVIDTSRFYGVSEERIGRALRELNARDSFVVCTKLDLPKDYDQLDDQMLMDRAGDSLYTSLDKLGMSELDVFLLHTHQYKVHRDGIIWDFVLKESAAGRIRCPGVSIGGGPTEALEAVADSTVRAVQIPYNVFDQRWRMSGFLEAAESGNVAVFGRSAYLQGLTLMDPESLVERLPDALPYVRRLRDLAARHDLFLKVVVLGYALSESRIATTVLGVDNPGQFEENLALYDQIVQEFHPEVTAEISQLFADVPGRIVDPSLWNQPYHGTGV